MDRETKRFLKGLRDAGKEQIITAMLERHRDLLPEDFDPAGFDRVVVKRKKDDLHVRFDFPIRYLPVGSAWRFSYEIGLGMMWSGTSITSNLKEGEDTPDEVGFWRPTEADREVIDFIMKVREEESISHRTHHTIREREDHYEVQVETPSASGWYKVEKGSGRVFGEGHKHKAISNRERWEIVRD